MNTYWKVKYNYQLAGWIVYNTSRGTQLRDVFPTKEDAREAAKTLNSPDKLTFEQINKLAPENFPSEGQFKAYWSKKLDSK